MSAPQFTIEPAPNMSLGLGWRWVVRRDGLRIASAGSRAEAKELLAQIKAREQMSAASTPGPWSVDLYGNVWAGNTRTALCDGPMFDDDRGDKPTRREANARLIAASPTMYDYVAKKAAEGDKEAARIVEIVHARS